MLVIYTTFRVFEQTLPLRFGPADARYRARKFVVFAGYLTTLLFLTILFQDRLGRLSFGIGVIAAGVAVARRSSGGSVSNLTSIRVPVRPGFHLAVASCHFRIRPCQPTTWARISVTDHPPGVTPGSVICRALICLGSLLSASRSTVMS